MVGDDDLPETPRATVPLAGAAARPGDPILGRVVAGRYRLVAERGRGGMSVVYEALETPLGRRVALKASGGDDPAARLRILREAAVLSCLDHPAIPPVYSSGSASEVGEYFVTKLVEATPLSRLPPEAALAHVAEAAEAVAYAHAQGFAHRDLKPAHILVDARGRATVIDWGLARELPERAAAPSLAQLAITEPGIAVGTPGYWSPEQRAGGLPDARADVYSLGAILARLFSGKEPDVDAPPDPGRAPRALRSLIARATAADPSARLASAAELAAALRRM